MGKSSPIPENDGKIILKSVKLTEPLVKPEIKDAVVPSEIHRSEPEPAKKTIITKIIDQLKKLKDELFK